MHKALWSAALLSLMAAQVVLAQDRLRTGNGQVVPSDAELKATYCMVVIDQQRQDLSSALKRLSASESSDPDTARVISKAVQDGNSHLALLNDRMSRLSSF